MRPNAVKIIKHYVETTPASPSVLRSVSD